jgi:hypothetical protein
MTVILSTSTFNPTGDGYDYSTNPNDLSVTVLPGVTIGSGTKFGVDAEFGVNNPATGFSLSNQGIIYSIDRVGVSFDVGGEITNWAGGIIFGSYSGVTMDTGSEVFNNFGTVVGTGDGSAFEGINALSMVVNNHGTIVGDGDAVFLDNISGEQH